MPASGDISRFVDDTINALAVNNDEFGRMIGKSGSVVHRWRNGTNMPQRENLMRVVRVSPLDPNAYGIRPASAADVRPLATTQDFDQAVATLQMKLDEVLLRLDEFAARCDR